MSSFNEFAPFRIKSQTESGVIKQICHIDKLQYKISTRAVNHSAPFHMAYALYCTFLCLSYAQQHVLLKKENVQLYSFLFQPRKG